MNNPLPAISFVIPLYNEEKVFSTLVTRLQKVMDGFDKTCEVVLVNDGSNDNTAMLITDICMQDVRFHGVLLSRNHGHQLALTAGLAKALGTEAIFVLDGDLQDPPELVHDFYTKIKEGYEVVFAVRKKRKENAFKKMAYHLFYRFLDKISYIKIPLDSGDFCMMSRRVVDVLNAMPEQSRYIRGMRTWVGFKQIGVPYERDARAEGDSKYSFKLLLKLAFEGIFNFSEFPIKIITRMGTLSFIFSFIYLATVIFKKIFYTEVVPIGFTAILATVILFSSAILISIGILGEYMLRIFFQTKGRPLYTVESEIVNKTKQINNAAQ